MTWYYYAALILFALSSLISLAVKTSFKANSKYSARYTGAQAAELILRRNGINNVTIVPIAGSLTDNYNPANKVLSLSHDVYYKANISAIAVAAHECGHAIQHATAYNLLKVRSAMVPVTRFSSSASYVLIMLGLAMSNSLFISIGTIVFSLIVIFSMLTLPIEIDASRRALQQCNSLYIYETGDVSKARKVLTAAGLTYFVSILSSLLTLARYIMMSQRRNSRRK